MIELAHIRNMLIRGYFNGEEEKMLLLTHIELLKLEGPFVSLIGSCIKNCINDIKIKNFSSAANEINFIHNLPVRYSDIKNWNEEHVYTLEIMDYLDNENAFRIKEYISKIAEAQNKITTRHV